MNLKSEQTASFAIVYDADRIQQPEQMLFEEAHWRRIGAVRGTAAGRGNVLFLDTGFGPAVLRAYLRGGFAAHISRDRYLFTGFSRSRPLREMRMLAECTRLGLPVPEPIAGRCVRHGLSYSAELLTGQIAPAQSLADLLDRPSGLEPDWFRTGRCIRRFHNAGVVHPDLNARNLLYGERGGRNDDIYLIDFDRACFCNKADSRFSASLRRLHRSLSKFWPPGEQGTLETCWKQVMKGYNSGR